MEYWYIYLKPVEENHESESRTFYWVAVVLLIYYIHVLTNVNDKLPNSDNINFSAIHNFRMCKMYRFYCQTPPDNFALGVHIVIVELRHIDKIKYFISSVSKWSNDLNLFCTDR